MARRNVHRPRPAAAKRHTTKHRSSEPREHGVNRTGLPSGLRERKKEKLRGQIIETSLRLFREKGYQNTRVDDIVQVLEISQPTFFRYFPSKDAVLREIGRRAFARQAESLKSELTTKASTAERLERFYDQLAKVTETGRPLWQAVILAGAMDPVRSPELRGAEQATMRLLREMLEQGQERGEITKEFPVVHLAEFMEGLFNTVVRQWAVDLTGPHKLAERAHNAVEFFLRGAKP